MNSFTHLLLQRWQTRRKLTKTTTTKELLAIITYFSDTPMTLRDSISSFLYDLTSWILPVDFLSAPVLDGTCEVDIRLSLSVARVFSVVVLWAVSVDSIVDGAVCDEELLLSVAAEVDCWVVFTLGEVGSEVLYIGEDVSVKAVDVISRLNEKIESATGDDFIDIRGWSVRNPPGLRATPETRAVEDEENAKEEKVLNLWVASDLHFSWEPSLLRKENKKRLRVQRLFSRFP